MSAVSNNAAIPSHRKVRNLRVYQKYRDNCKGYTAEINLCGKWLQKLGFEAGCEVIVKPVGEMIVIKKGRKLITQEEMDRWLQEREVVKAFYKGVMMKLSRRRSGSSESRVQSPEVELRPYPKLPRRVKRG